MMDLVKDPVILISSGILLAAIMGLIWAIGKIRRLSTTPVEQGKFVDDFVRESPAAPVGDLEIAPAPVMTVTHPPPVVSRDVADRLESMTQRLAEMQAVLSKQASTPGAVETGSVGQGFSPETIDKLLKIIGNVMQQVDILQKSVSGTKDGAAPKAETPAAKV